MAESFSMFRFGREVCGDVLVASRREWLVTNGIGGFASGTVSGLLTRRYHGLLFAALLPPLGRTLLVTGLDPAVTYCGEWYPLYSYRWATGIVDPGGYNFLESFHLEGTTPVWTFAFADALLQKRIWMQPGANTTYVQFTLARASAPADLEVTGLVNYRDYHAATRQELPMQITALENGLQIQALENVAPFYIFSEKGSVTPDGKWYRDFWLAQEKFRGYDGKENHLCAGQFHITLQPGETVTMAASTDPAPSLNGARALAERRAHETRLLAGFRRDPEWVRQLALAADQFVVQRHTPDQEQGYTIMAGYPWFGDWGRDAMLSLPGLTITTGRPEVARAILRTYARFVDRGMLPNRFPDAGTQPEYNTVDAALWYFEALRAYHAATRDDDLIQELYPILKDIIDWHRRGTRYQIHASPGDGLLYAGEPGMQLTWMDVKIGDWVVTPRHGKAVEINALWYNALRVMGDLSRRLGKASHLYDAMADRVQESFKDFWYDAGGYCYDVISTPTGADPSLRPNQLLAVSLPYSPLEAGRQKGVVDVCARHLLTSFGLRSLAPEDVNGAPNPAYGGHYGGEPAQRDAVYHQGTVWSWLMGPFVSAHYRVYCDRAAALNFLEPLAMQMKDYGVGTIGEIFDGNPPFAPHGCIAQAWGVSELLRVWKFLQAQPSA